MKIMKITVLTAICIKIKLATFVVSNLMCQALFSDGKPPSTLNQVFVKIYFSKKLQ